ncbi:MAG: DUF3313 family protein [Phenylobacterium sp.]|uniref:DUF3313 family protein n=1 Tax=Phenylobacterium sp. TaxID=1871053 RepID=UPI00391AD483
MRPAVALVLLASLGACAAPAKNSGFLTRYDGLEPRSGTVRAAISERRDAERLAAVSRVHIEPTALASEPPVWLTPQERTALLREMDAQLCFELSERFEIATAADAADARVRAAVTEVKPTGRVGSAAAAAAGFFIPGPIGLRPPGTLGALAAEAEMVAPGGDQLAAIAWSRAATAIGTDNPSLSRIGDALQFVEPFADAAAQVMSPEGAQARKIGDPDPCAAYGPRFRPEGFAARFATGLYVPQASGARPEEAPKP